MKIYIFLIALLPSILFGQSLRPLSPDRPHQTESPYTTDKKHFQLEGDLFNHFDHPAEKESEKGIFFFNLKYGLTHNTDIELLTGTFLESRNTESRSQTWFPDLIIRYKYNLTGNDSGRFSLAVMPLMHTSNFFRDQFKIINYGLLLNAELEIGEHCGLGYTGGLSSISKKGNDQELFSTFSFDYPVYKALHHFVEVSWKGAGNFKPYYSFDSGLTLTPGPNLQFDAGAYFFPDNKDLFLFIGFTRRI